MTVLLIDNYDSFTHNLAQMIGGLGYACEVVRNDAIAIGDVAARAPHAIVLSPGPGHPNNPRDFGVCAPIIDALSASIPTLGVCLGHQGIAARFGADVVRAPTVMHGKTSRIVHDGSSVFEGLPPSIEVMRYHSLIVDEATLPTAFRVTARTEPDGLLMGIAHKERPLHGVQFHPESIGTPDGPALLRTFLAGVGA